MAYIFHVVRFIARMACANNIISFKFPNVLDILSFIFIL